MTVMDTIRLYFACKVLDVPTTEGIYNVAENTFGRDDADRK